MWFYMKLAWRNIFRNKRRTIIAGTAIGIGLASLIFMDALIIGMKDNLIKSATGSFLGEAQIHGQGFRSTQEVENTVRNLSQVVSSLKKEEVVEAFTLRTLSMGMITSPANVSSILCVGIHPDTEKNLSQIDEAIREGEYFGDENERDIVIGSKLAEILEVSLGDRVVVTVSQAKSGDLSQEMFRISGIYHLNITEMDRGMAFIRLEKAQEMLGLGGEVHEIALKFKEMSFADQKENPFWEKYSAWQNEAVSWVEVLPQLKTIFEFSNISLFIIGIILFGVVSFGIINTLFMSLYERMFEFGVLRAVGTRSSGIRRLIILEAGSLAVLSIIFGTILGFVVTFIFTKVGIDYQGIEFVGTTFRELLYPVMKLYQFIVYPVSVLLFTMIIGLYPAIIAGRMSIANALRKSL